MNTTSPSTANTLPPSQSHPGEQRIVLHGVTWTRYRSIASAFETLGGVRLTYFRGALEIMTLSFDHEGTKTCIARLLETYAEERGIALNGFGEATLGNEESKREIQPDECYFVGPRACDVPDLAVEVVLTSGGIDKLEVNRGLGVGEVWRWQSGRMSVHVLTGDCYESVERSRLFPDLDVEALARFIEPDRQTESVRAWRAALRA
jgi:Uma2 family endonuclease